MKLPLNDLPIQREVREWQKTDLNTGARLSGRFEAHRTVGALKKYGQVVDTQNMIARDGTLLAQHKQLEVFQARTGSGSMRVVKSSTIVSSTSRKLKTIAKNLDPIDFTAGVTIEEIPNENEDVRVPLAILNGSHQHTEAKINNGERKLPHKNGNTSDVDLHLKPKIPIRRKKLLAADKYIENQTDLPGSFVCISKIKKDFENTMRQKTNLNKIQMSKHNQMYGISRKSPTKEDKNIPDNVNRITNGHHIVENHLAVAEKKKSYSNNSKNLNNKTSITISLNPISPNGNMNNSDVHGPLDRNGLSRIETLIENGRRRSSRIFVSSSVVDHQNKKTIVNIRPATDRLHPPHFTDHGQYKSRIPIRTSKVPINSITNNEQPPNEINVDQIEHDSLKRVKFCKTEIHFTAESGRVAIVETDTKPPSVRLHRRRDRSYRHTYLRTMIDNPMIDEIEKDSTTSINLSSSTNIPNLASNAIIENNEKTTTTTTTTTICSRISLSALNNLIDKSNDNFNNRQTVDDDEEQEEEDIAFSKGKLNRIFVAVRRNETPPKFVPNLSRINISGFSTRIQLNMTPVC